MKHVQMPGFDPVTQSQGKAAAIPLLQRFWETATSPRSQDETLARREYMTRVVLFSMMWLLSIFTLIILAGTLFKWFALLDVGIMLAILLPVLAGWWIAMQGGWRPAALIPPLVFLLLGAYGTFSAGMVTNFVLAYAIAILLAGVLLSSNHAWGMVLVSVVLHMGLGWQRQPIDSLEFVIIMIPFTGFLVGIAMVQHFFSRVLQNALDHTRNTAQRLRQEVHERQEAERELRQRNRELLLVNQVVAASNSTLQLHETLQTTLQALVVGLGMEQGGVALLEPEHHHLRVMAEYPPDENISVVGAVIPIEGNLSTQYVLSNRKALSIIDARNDPRMAMVQDLMRSRNIQSLLIIPLIVHNQVIGTLGLESSTLHEFSEEEIALASNATLATAQAIENSNLYSQVQNLALHDELTGVLNRRGLSEFGRREVERARRFGRSLAALFIDVDLLKRVNDRLGHATGDFALQQIATSIRQHTRDVDVVGRYGGDEFLVLLTETDLPRAAEIAQRLSATVQAKPILAESSDLKLSVSIGVASLTMDMESLDALIIQADRAMYIAKEQGRNQVIVSPVQN